MSHAIERWQTVAYLLAAMLVGLIVSFVWEVANDVEPTANQVAIAECFDAERVVLFVEDSETDGVWRIVWAFGEPNSRGQTAEDVIGKSAAVYGRDIAENVRDLVAEVFDGGETTTFVTTLGNGVLVESQAVELPDDVLAVCSNYPNGLEPPVTTTTTGD